MDLRDQMGVEEKPRFDRQVETEHQKLIAIGQGHLHLQVLPIRVPDAVPKAIYKKKKKKKKTHGLTNARGLVSAEIAVLELKKREALARKSRVRPRPFEDDDDDDDDDEGIQVYDTPPRRTTPIGGSQRGTTITIALRPSPEQRR
jgi:hypothetical protein